MDKGAVPSLFSVSHLVSTRAFVFVFPAEPVSLLVLHSEH